jgi:hypothetical protein
VLDHTRDLAGHHHGVVGIRRVLLVGEDEGADALAMRAITRSLIDSWLVARNRAWHDQRKLAAQVDGTEE